ncbi:MAG: citrate synthase, partial [Ilumatobacteraceae bacterium]
MKGITVADTITIIDDRTGKKVTVPVTDGVFASSALRELDPNLRMYDPAFLSTAACASSITYLDGDAGILRYRGYPIEQLAEHSTFLEVAYLLLNGELPTTAELDKWTFDVTHHTMIHENMRKRFVDGFHYDAHPMGMFISAVAALGTFYNSAKRIFDEDALNKQILRLVAKVPTIAAMTYRFSKGLPFVLPNNSMNYAQNFLNMMYRIGDDYRVDPVLARAMDVLFILHADHEQNCGTTTMRVVASANADPYSSVAAAAAALYGPLHGGANEACLTMLNELQAAGGVEKLGEFIQQVKDKTSKVKLMGFGHRVYKNYDPRAKLMRETCYEVLGELGLQDDPLFALAMKLEQIALEDEYFVERKLYPNVDFYSGIILKAIGIPTSMFTVIFAVGRTPGWVSHWNEMISNSYKIGRPRQLYSGH